MANTDKVTVSFGAIGCIAILAIGAACIGLVIGIIILVAKLIGGMA